MLSTEAGCFLERTQDSASTSSIGDAWCLMKKTLWYMESLSSGHGEATNPTFEDVRRLSQRTESTTNEAFKRPFHSKESIALNRAGDSYSPWSTARAKTIFSVDRARPGRISRWRSHANTCRLSTDVQRRARKPRICSSITVRRHILVEVKTLLQKPVLALSVEALESLHRPRRNCSPTLYVLCTPAMLAIADRRH